MLPIALPHGQVAGIIPPALIEKVLQGMEEATVDIPDWEPTVSAAAAATAATATAATATAATAAATTAAAATATAAELALLRPCLRLVLVLPAAA